MINNKKNFFYVISIITILHGCRKTDMLDNSAPIENQNTLTYEIDFPSYVYTHKKYKGEIRFYNKMFDTIAEPRRDTANFRFIIYKPFEPYKSESDSGPVFKDSILLEKNTIGIEYQFESPGTYTIGGFARDGIRIKHYTNGINDSVRFIEAEILFFKKIVVRDSI